MATLAEPTAQFPRLPHPAPVAAGVRAEHRCVEGQVHGFFSMSAGVDSARVALDEIIAALRAALHPA